MVGGRTRGEQGSGGSPGVWGHRSHAKQGGVHSQEGCVWG